MSSIKIDYAYAIGEFVLLDGKPKRIENRGYNINHVPTYNIDGEWFLEFQLTPMPVAP